MPFLIKVSWFWQTFKKLIFCIITVHVLFNGKTAYQYSVRVFISFILYSLIDITCKHVNILEFCSKHSYEIKACKALEHTYFRLPLKVMKLDCFEGKHFFPVNLSLLTGYTKFPVIDL